MKEINYNSLFESLPRITGLPWVRRGRMYYGKFYLDGTPHRRRDKSVAYMKGSKIILCEQGAGGIIDLWQLFSDRGMSDLEIGNFLRAESDSTYVAPLYVEPSPVFVYPHIVERTLGQYTDVLFKYLCTLYAEDRVKWAYRELNVGSRGDATVYWYKDKNGKFLHDKQITYKMDGHRNKEIHPTRKMKSGNGFTGRCYFGEHLPHDKAFVVEAEKTVLVAKIAYPNRIFLATGGSNNLNRNPSHLLLPDLDQIESWKERGEVVEWWKHYDIQSLGEKCDIADAILHEKRQKMLGVLSEK